jgi:hypothetical protein
MSRFRPRHERVSVSADERDRQVQIACALIDAASGEALRELERGLRWHLYRPPEAGARRTRELGFLRELLLDVEAIGGDIPYIERARYDQLRPPRAPASESLQRRFGSWAMACVYASSIDEAGAYRRGISSPPLDRKHVSYGKPYTLDECLAAVRECAADLGRIPTSQDYVLWRRLRCAATKAAGKTPRIPHCDVIYRFFLDAGTHETRWRATLECAMPMMAGSGVTGLPYAAERANPNE